VNQLQELIRRRAQERGWSYAEVARRGGLPRSTVHNLATNPRLLRLPQPATLAGLARGLDVAPAVVRGAAAEAAGFRLYEERGDDPEVATLIAGVEQLDPADRRHVAALVESLLRHARERHPYGPVGEKRPTRLTSSLE
jgi:transcriptional regulator with XRE-family HTH domain